MLRTNRIVRLDLDEGWCVCVNRIVRLDIDEGWCVSFASHNKTSQNHKRLWHRVV